MDRLLIDVDIPLHSSVFLLSAGPGDPSLVCLKTLYILQRVDVVLYDYLAHPSLLLYCRSEAELLCVGKRKGAHSVQQHRIHSMIQSAVQEGKTVARLKGGDAVTFSRGGEEMAFLDEHQISYDVVPGVSSFNGVLGQLGIPLTHRDWSRSVALISASSKQEDSLQKVTIPHTDTLVFFMAGSHLDTLIPRLIAEHPTFDAHTPILVISNGTLAKEKVIDGTLGTIADLLSRQVLSPPVMMVVGQVCQVYNQRRCNQNRPLLGRRIWVFKPEQHSTTYLSTLSSLGAEVVAIPLIDIKLESLDHPDYLAQFKQSNTLIFTSQNGVAAFWEWLKRHRLDLRSLAGKRICAIGSQTSERLKSRHIFPDFVPSQMSSEGFLGDYPFDWDQTIAIFPQSTQARGIISEFVQKKGGVSFEWPLYRTSSPSRLPEVHWQPGDYAYVTSPSIVDALFENIPPPSDLPIHWVSSGSFTQKALIRHGISSSSCLSSPSISSLIDYLKHSF